jgi:hypothetical protein
MIEKLWLYPPLAFARLGPSETPCDNYSWGPNDVTARGSGKTTVEPRTTLAFNDDGTLTSYTPPSLTFKDEHGFRPVCPFFELHGQWRIGEQRCSGPIVPSLLQKFGIASSDVEWRVDVANLKAFRYTKKRGDRIEASVQLHAETMGRHELLGVSPVDEQSPLVPEGASIHLGWVQVPRLTEDLPTYRLRFTPPKGLVYAATDFNERLVKLARKADLARKKTMWTDVHGNPFQLPEGQRILNPSAAWSTFKPEKRKHSQRGDKDRDFRTMPLRIFAFDDTKDDDFESLGMVDDISDGLVRCRIDSIGLEAVARIVVTPPRYAPDRRPMVSLADGLKDRVDRKDVDDEAFIADPQTTAEVRDLLERVFETLGLMNLDALNDRSHRLNTETAREAAILPPRLEAKLFARIENVDNRPLPLTELGRQRHRRMLALEVLEDRLREDPTLIERFVRPPVSGDPYFDQRMPPLTTGSDGHPLHVSRRQYELLRAWARGLRRIVKEGI